MVINNQATQERKNLTTDANALQQLGKMHPANAWGLTGKLEHTTTKFYSGQ
jgi:hypothetical protein